MNCLVAIIAVFCWIFSAHQYEGVESATPTIGPGLIDQFTQLLQDVKTAKV